jgi:hypothetical protein
MSAACRAAMNDYVKDHLKHFRGLPMDFEFKGKVYDFDAIQANLDEDNDKTYTDIVDGEMDLMEERNRLTN